MVSSKSVRTLVAAAGASLGLAATVQAATITGTYSATPTAADANLTTVGTIDWAVWAPSSNSATATNSKNVSTHLIGLTVTPVGGNTVAKVGGSSLPFAYTDGTSPTSFGTPTAATMGGVGGATVSGSTTTWADNYGIQFTVKADPSLQPLNVSIYVAGYGANSARLTAQLPGASDYQYTVSTPYGTASPKNPDLLTLTFTPDNASDQLTVKWTMLTHDSLYPNSHVLLQAVAVSPVPEPASIWVLGLAGVMVLRRQRRTA